MPAHTAPQGLRAPVRPSPGSLSGKPRRPPMSLSLGSLGTSETRLQIHEVMPMENLARCLRSPFGGPWGVPGCLEPPKGTCNTLSLQQHHPSLGTPAVATHRMHWSTGRPSLRPLLHLFCDFTPPTPSNPGTAAVSGDTPGCNDLEGVAGVQQAEPGTLLNTLQPQRALCQQRRAEKPQA